MIADLFCLIAFWKGVERMEERWDSVRPYRLSMDDFVAPDRRMDAFPSKRYEVPPVYVSDAVSVTYPADCDVTVRVESQTLFLEKGECNNIDFYGNYDN